MEPFLVQLNDPVLNWTLAEVDAEIRDGYFLVNVAENLPPNALEMEMHYANARDATTEGEARRANLRAAVKFLTWKDKPSTQ